MISAGFEHSAAIGPLGVVESSGYVYTWGKQVGFIAVVLTLRDLLDRSLATFQLTTLTPIPRTTDDLETASPPQVL